MSGYTPLFSSVFDGTLYGRWPHTGVWVCLLAMADKHGQVDKAPKVIASAIGIDTETLAAVLNDFCSPDPDSRTSASEGRRLELIDPSRPWGWRIVNHAKYREKARKSAYDAARAESGQNADRKRAEREQAAATRDDPTRPAMTRADPPSNTNTNTNTNTNADADADKIRNPLPPADAGGSPPAKPTRRKPTQAPTKTQIADDFTLTPERHAYALAKIPDCDPGQFLEKFRSESLMKGWTYANWDQAWQTYVRNSAPGSGHFAAGQYPRIGGGIRWT